MDFNARQIAVWAAALLLFFGAGCEKRSAIDGQSVIPTVNDSRTDVLPYSTDPIDPRRNYIYCATFQLAWDELRDQLGKQPIRLKGDPNMARILNDHPFERSNVSPDDYLVMAGRTDQGIVAKIREAMTKRFPRAEFVIPDAPVGDGFIVYSYLTENLPFAVKFNVADGPLEFHTSERIAKVSAFEAKFKANTSQSLREQITILDYRDYGDFILRLNTTSKDDELILAMVPPAKTLNETIESSQQRIKNSRTTSAPEDGDFLMVPVISFAIERKFYELNGLVVEHLGHSESYIADARQDIRFRLDEGGARLESSARVNVESKIHRMFIFNHPFLLYIQRVGASAPYFAAWIANEDLFKHWGRASNGD